MSHHGSPLPRPLSRERERGAGDHGRGEPEVLEFALDSGTGGTVAGLT